MPECPTCNGEGYVQEPAENGSTIEVTCPDCNGTGDEY